MLADMPETTISGPDEVFRAHNMSDQGVLLELRVRFNYVRASKERRIWMDDSTHCIAQGHSDLIVRGDMEHARFRRTKLAVSLFRRQIGEGTTKSTATTILIG